MARHDTAWRIAGLALAWLSGVALQLHERDLLDAWVYGSCTGLAACLAVAAHRTRTWVPWMLALALIGFGLTGTRAVLRVAQTLPAALEGQDLVVQGVVASLPQPGAAGTRFRFRVESALHQGQRVELPPLLALGWYHGVHEDARIEVPRTALRAGQRWRFTLRLRQPHGNVNHHGFDYELYLFELGVGATGYVRDAPAALIGASTGFSIDAMRQAVRDAVEARVGERRIAGVIAALAIGDQAAIDREDWDLFRNTGVAHLMSISGLHVTMFAWLAGALIGTAWRRFPRAMLRVPAPAAARWGGLLAAALYALLSGWGVPAQRTVWMLAAVTALHGTGLAWPWPLALLAAAAVVAALDPWAMLQPGFWLSFGAVALLMGSRATRALASDGPAATGWRGPLVRLGTALRGGVRTQAIATVGLTPLTLVFFQQVSLVGLIANLFAIPLVTLIITPLALLGVIAAPLWGLAAWVTQTLVAALAWLGAIPGAVWGVPAAPAWAQLGALLGAVLLVMPLPWRARSLSVPLALPLLLATPQVPAPGRFELLALDVGQGTAVLVRTRGHLLLYDAGPQYSRDSDAGQRVLLPLLRGRGERRIDRLVLSHRDSDHVGGARALLAALPVSEVLSSLDETHLLTSAAPARTRCAAGQSWVWDGVRFDVLHPPDSAYERRLAPNALSCVLRVSSGVGSVLLTGDIEREQEAALAAAYGEVLRSDVLVVPHHGSKTSSSEPFLGAVAAKTAVVQAGYRNRFGHPAAEVLERHSERGTKIVQNAACGAWHWSGRTDDAGRCLREATRRYWRHPVHAGAGSGEPGSRESTKGRSGVDSSPSGGSGGHLAPPGVALKR